MLPETVGVAMQLAQFMVQNLGLNFSKDVDGPQQLPEGVAIQNAMHTSAADMIEKSGRRFEWRLRARCSCLGLSWAHEWLEFQDSFGLAHV